MRIYNFKDAPAYLRRIAIGDIITVFSADEVRTNRIQDIVDALGIELENGDVAYFSVRGRE